MTFFRGGLEGIVDRYSPLYSIDIGSFLDENLDNIDVFLPSLRGGLEGITVDKSLALISAPFSTRNLNNIKIAFFPRAAWRRHCHICPYSIDIGPFLDEESEHHIEVASFRGSLEEHCRSVRPESSI